MNDSNNSWRDVFTNNKLILINTVEVILVSILWVLPSTWFNSLLSRTIGLLILTNIVIGYFIVLYKQKKEVTKSTQHRTQSKREIQQIKNELEQENQQRNSISEQLKRLTTQLQKKVEQQAAQIERALEIQAAKEDTIRLRYLGLMASATAHEINQPIGIIRAATDAALDDIKEGYFKQEDLVPLLESILGQTERLNAITNYFRTFSRGDRIEREAVALNDLVARVVANFTHQFKHHNIALHLDIETEDEASPLPSVWANPFQIEEVLINLLINARDAVEDQTDATVWVKTWHNKKGRCGFIIEDNGPGVPDEYQKQLFIPFTSTKSTEKGLGLGLYISQDVVKKFDGTLTYKKRAEGGSTFIIDLPIFEGDKSNGNTI